MYKNSICKFIRYLLAGLSISSSLASAGVITRITDTTDLLVMDWSLDDWSVQPTDSFGTTKSRISFSGSNFDATLPTGELVPCFALWFGTPSAENGSVNIVPLEVKSIRLQHQPCRPIDGPAAISWLKGDDWTRIARDGIFRGLHAKHLVINPFDYDSTTMILRVLTKARITVTFQPSVFFQTMNTDSSEYERMVADLIINYPTAVHWRPLPIRGVAKTRGMSSRLAQGTFLHFRIGNDGDSINEGTTAENGLIRIYGSQINRLGQNVAIANVVLYGSIKGEMPQMAPDPDSISDGLIEIPVIRIDVDHDGIVDDDDYLLAYITGASDWGFKENEGYNFRLNHYDNFRNYWIGIKASTAATMATAILPAKTSNTALTTFTEHQYYKQSVLRPNPNQQDHDEGGYNWVWKRLTETSPVFECPVDLAGMDTLSVFSLKYRGKSLFNHSWVQILLGDKYDFGFGFGFTENMWLTVPKSGNLASSTLAFHLINQSADTDLFELQDFEIKYTKKMDMSGCSTLAIFAAETTSVVTYQINNIPLDGVRIIRIPKAENLISIVNPAIQGNTCSWSDSAGQGIRYFVCTQAAIRSIDSLVLVSPDSRSGYVLGDLRSIANKSNYLIVTDTLFLNQANSLAIHKAQFSSIASCTPKIVLMNDVYREFSGGNTDPSALRNFLAYAYAHWNGGLEYVVFLGSGHYDYLHVKSSKPVFIPVFENGDSYNGSACIEGFFAALDSGETYNGQPDIFLGRLPCSTPQEAVAVVEKIRDMEDPARADFSAWRNRVLLVADDDMNGGNDPLGQYFTPHSEDLATQGLSKVPWVNLRKVYLFDYKWNSELQKPLARQSILSEINNGVGFACFNGHGDPYQWSFEVVLAKSDITTLHNHLKYPVVMSFACTVGPFDWPDSLRSLGETLVTTPNAGAIASIACTRLSYASPDQILSSEYFKYQFDPIANRTIGQAFTNAVANYAVNKNYALLGDPSIRMSPRSGSISVGIEDISGSLLDTLHGNSRVIVRGRVHPCNDSLSVRTDSTFGTAQSPATIVISLIPPPDSSFRKDDTLYEPAPPYTMPSPPVFSVTVPVVNGQFMASIQLPINLPKHRDSLVLTAYAWCANRLAMGVDSGYSIVPSTNLTKSDTTPPIVEPYSAHNDYGANMGTSITGAFVCSLPAIISISLRDSSGLDLTSTSSDSGVSIEIPGFVPKTNINHLVRIGDTNKEAVAIFRLDGKISTTTCFNLIVHASDLFGNTSIDTFRLFLTTKADNEVVLSKLLKDPDAFTNLKKPPFSKQSAIALVLNSPKTRQFTNLSFGSPDSLSTNDSIGTSSNSDIASPADGQSNLLFQSDFQANPVGDLPPAIIGTLPIARVYASSFTHRNYPAGAIDHDPHTRWTPLAGYQSLILDLGSQRTIHNILLTYYATTCKERILSVAISAQSDKTGTSVQSSITGKGFGRKEISIPPAKGRFVTLTFLPLQDLTVPNIIEAEVLGE